MNDAVVTINLELPFDTAIKQKPKYGSIRADGKVYYQMKRGREQWITPESFERTRLLQNEWNRKNKEHISQRYKKWKSKNKTRRADSQKQWNRRMYHTDPIYKITVLLRVHLTRTLNLAKMKKNMSSFEYAGCTPAFLRQHIESQFKDGMTWDNHASVWELDHIRPLCTFDLTDPEQRIKANHYSNLRPLEKHLNATTWRDKKREHLLQRRSNNPGQTEAMLS